MQAVTPEHDLMSQRAVAGLLMSDPSAMTSAVRECVTSAWFSDPACIAVVSACMDLHGAGNPVDLVTVTTEITRQGKLKSIGGAGAVAGLDGDAGLSGSAEYWIGSLRAAWKRREAIRLVSRFLSDVTNGDVDPSEGASGVLSVIAGMDRRLTERRPWRAYILDAITSAEAAANGQPESSGIPIGIQAFDHETGGISPGLIVVAAETSGGKSLFMIQAAIELARFTGKPALIASLEMSGKQIAQRALAAAATVPLNFMTRGTPRIGLADYQRFSIAAQQLAEVPIVLEYCPGATSGQIRSMAFDAAGTIGLSCVVVDYMQLMSADAKAESREQAVSESARRLKIMQAELGCPVIVGSQLNDDGRLRESRAIGMHADEVYQIQHGMESKLVFVKRRQGAKGEIPIKMVGEYARFEDV